MYRILFYIFRLFKGEPIIVYGMHRSGTSMFARTLSDANVHMGNLMNNNQESIHFLNYNDLLLKESGASWDQPMPLEQLQPNYKAVLFTLIRHFGNPFTISFYRSFFKAKWGWKDPRNTFTLQLWTKLFPKARLIHVYRHPVHSASSLQRRNLKMRKDHPQYIGDFSELSNCLNLWKEYVDEALKYEELRNSLSIQYEKLISIDVKTISLLERFLNFDITHLLEERTIPENNKKNTGLSLDQEKQFGIFSLARKLGYS